MNQKLPKILKLKSKKEIEVLFKRGKTLKSYPLMLVYLQGSLEVPFKVGFSVSKKHFKKAVDRNRIKRLLRENFRKNKYIFTDNEQQFLLMFIYIGNQMCLYEDIEKALKKIEKKWQYIGK